MANPNQQYSNSRHTNIPLNNQNQSCQYPPNYSPPIPVRLNQQKITNSQGKQIYYVANPRESQFKVADKNGSLAEGQDFRQSRFKEYGSNLRSQLPTMANQHLIQVDKRDLKFEEQKKKTQMESKVGSVEKSGQMFCGCAGWIIGCIVGLLILTALLLFGLGVIGGTINIGSSSDSSKVSSQYPIITSRANLSSSSSQQSALSPEKGTSSINDSSIIGKTIISSIPASPLINANKTQVSPIASTTISEANIANKL